MAEDPFIDYCNKFYFYLSSQGKPRILAKFRLYIDPDACDSEQSVGITRIHKQNRLKTQVAVELHYLTLYLPIS